MAEMMTRQLRVKVCSFHLQPPQEHGAGQKLYVSTLWHRVDQLLNLLVSVTAVISARSVLEPVKDEGQQAYRTIRFVATKNKAPVAIV